MRKSTKNIISILFVAALIAGIFAFFAWGTNWFTSTVRLRKLFGDESSTATTATVDHGLNKSAANDNNIYLDGDDAAMTVSVQYAAAPFVYTTSKGLMIYDQYSIYVSSKTEVKIGFKSNYDVENETFYNSQYKTFLFTNDIYYPYTQTYGVGSPFNIHYISYEEVYDAADELGWDGTQSLVVVATGLDFSSLGTTYLSKTYGPLSFELHQTAVSMYLSGSDLVCVFPDNISIDAIGTSFNISFYLCDGSDFTDSEMYLFIGSNREQYSRDGNTITVRLASILAASDKYLNKVFNVFVMYGGQNVLIGGLFQMSPFRFGVSKLDCPTNLQYKDGILSWDPVDNALGYYVSCTVDHGPSYFVTVTEPQFDFHGYSPLEYIVRVRAIGNTGTNLIDTASVTAFNASVNIQQVVALNYNIDGDVITKFVPYGDELSKYLSDVDIQGREFGGWYYDSGYSVKVMPTDVIDSDMTIYARLSNVQVTERPLSWFELHKWQVLIPCFVVGGLILLGVLAAVVVKKKAGK